MSNEDDKTISSNIFLSFIFSRYAFAIWYHLYNLKVSDNHGGVILLAKLQACASNFTKNITTPWVFSRFLNRTNGSKLR